MRSLAVLVFLGVFNSCVCSRMRFDQQFHEPMYRNDHQFRTNGGMHQEPVYKREHFVPREAFMSPEQMIPQPGLMRNEGMYGNDPMNAPMNAPQSQVMPPQEYLQNEPIMPNEHFMRAEPVIRREPLMRREPLIRREPFIRPEPIIPNDRIFSSPQVIREEPIFRNQPNHYALMLTQCPCAHEPQNFAPIPPQETFFQIPQPIQQQPIVAHRIFCAKPVKPQIYQPMIAFPRLQRFIRKGFRPIPENVQMSPPSMANGQEFNSFNGDQIQFQGNFQNQSPPQENASEQTQNNPVTMRNVPSVPPPLNLAQMSSIC